MGRFASTIDFYTRYREPYPREFFVQVAEHIVLRGDEALLDIDVQTEFLVEQIVAGASVFGRIRSLNLQVAGHRADGLV
jgi:hypothetical protein